MTKIKNETQYRAALQRIDELLKVVSNETPADDKNFIELDLISDLVADYEEVHYPIKPLTLVETIELRMEEMGFNREGLSKFLNLSKGTVSGILSGKREPNLRTARTISQRLNIDAAVVLGV